jgi:hypothetical protein
MLASRSLRAFKAAPKQAPRVSRRAVVVQAKKNEVSASYAKALVELADEKGKLEAVNDDMNAVANLMKENAKLAALMMNPVVDGEKKRAVLAKVAKEAGFNQYTINFLNLLVEKDRLNLVPEICESFEELFCELTDTQVPPKHRAADMPKLGLGGGACWAADTCDDLRVLSACACSLRRAGGHSALGCQAGAGAAVPDCQEAPGADRQQEH